MGKGKEYTLEDEEYLRKNYGKILGMEIAKNIGHSYSSIRQKAKKMGLTSELDHSPEQIRKMSEKKSKQIFPEAYHLTSELAYILGVMAGDGYLNIEHPKRIWLGVKDKDFALHFKNILEKWSGLKAKMYKYKNSEFATIKFLQGFHWEVMLNSSRAVEFLKPFDIFRLKNKAVENIRVYLKDNYECKIKFIEGFFDSEGSIRDYNRIALDNKNKDLIRYVSELLNELDIEHKLYTDKHDMNRISVQTKESIGKLCELINSVIERKKKRMTEKLENEYFSGKEIKKRNLDFYFELVESEKGNFKIFEQIIKQYHSYKPSAKTIGKRINWIIREKGTDKLIGVVGIANSFLFQGTRDRYIGWNKEQRLRNISKIANNWRFCLLPEVPKNTASKVLSILKKEGMRMWKEKYGINLVLLETYVAIDKAGTSYKASNWIKIGETRGFNIKFENGIRKIIDEKGVKKSVYILPLVHNWREELLN